jgi:hypothetical protein
MCLAVTNFVPAFENSLHFNAGDGRDSIDQYSVPIHFFFFHILAACSFIAFRKQKGLQYAFIAGAIAIDLIAQFITPVVYYRWFLSRPAVFKYNCIAMMSYAVPVLVEPLFNVKHKRLFILAGVCCISISIGISRVLWCTLKESNPRLQWPGWFVLDFVWFAVEASQRLKKTKGSKKLLEDDKLLVS